MAAKSILQTYFKITLTNPAFHHPPTQPVTNVGFYNLHQSDTLTVIWRLLFVKAVLFMSHVAIILWRTGLVVM